MSRGNQILQVASWVVVGLVWATAYVSWLHIGDEGWFVFPMPAFMTGVLIFAVVHNRRVRQRGDSYRQLLAFYNLQSRLDQFAKLPLAKQEQFRGRMDEHGGIGFVVGGVFFALLLGGLSFESFDSSLRLWLVLPVAAVLFLILFSRKWFALRGDLVSSLNEVAPSEAETRETARNDSMAKVKWHKSMNPADRLFQSAVIMLLIISAFNLHFGIPLMSVGNPVSILVNVFTNTISMALVMGGIIWLLAFPHPEQTVCFRFLARWRIPGIPVWVQTAAGGLVLIALGVATFYAKLKIFGP